MMTKVIVTNCDNDEKGDGDDDKQDGDDDSQDGDDDKVSIDCHTTFPAVSFTGGDTRACSPQQLPD